MMSEIIHPNLAQCIEYFIEGHLGFIIIMEVAKIDLKTFISQSKVRLEENEIL